ncbi:MAG: hypothetical protein QG553_942 [Patescibacteria group bacterium]|nr:hypothetical protein [Patescibacteria group bacterium]
MDPRLQQLTNDIIRLADQLARETRETQGYLQRQDIASAIRNTADNTDELQTLVRQYQTLLAELQRQPRR